MNNHDDYNKAQKMLEERCKRADRKAGIFSSSFCLTTLILAGLCPKTLFIILYSLSVILVVGYALGRICDFIEKRNGVNNERVNKILGTCLLGVYVLSIILGYVSIEALFLLPFCLLTLFLFVVALNEIIRPLAGAIIYKLKSYRKILLLV